MSTAEEMLRTFEQLTAEATQLAGQLGELAQRATTYHHLYLDSGRNHIFPLIAAHGALWAGGYFRKRLNLARWLAWETFWSASRRRSRLEQVERLADAFREINRRVCVDTYVNYHFVKQYGHSPLATRFVSPPLLDALNLVHAARRANRELSDAEKRQIFAVHFFDEQQRVVGPAIKHAMAQFDWPFVSRLAMAPTIRFAYFTGNHRLRFRRFDDTQQRITNGLRAFDLAAAAGWQHVERALADYRLLPSAFFDDAVANFQTIRRQRLQVVG